MNEKEQKIAFVVEVKKILPDSVILWDSVTGREYVLHEGDAFNLQITENGIHNLGEY